MIQIKNAAELQKMRKACAISAAALKAGGEAIEPGITTAEIDKIIYDFIVRHGARPNFLHLYGFPATACISVNDTVIHGIPNKQQQIRPGDIVSIDTGCKIDGFNGDNACTYACGKIDLEAQRLLDAAAPGETVTVPAQVELPAVTAEELEQVLFRDVLGEARTHVGGTSARRSNVKLSAASINEYVMNSGDVFSYNDVVGQRTAARGYQAAPAYVQGETVDEIGGGICQTSSTLYLACLRSNLEITERYAHRYVPAYITAGMDATVSWGGPDYKFTNNSLYPIKIVTIYENNYLTVRILGTNVDGTSVKMTNEHLSTTPYETVYEDDPTLAPGTEKVKTTPYTGYKYRTYRNVYDANGKLISSAYEATSDYKSRNKVILRGPAVEPADGGAQIPTDTTEPTTPVEPTEPQDPGVPTEPAEPGAPDGGWTIQTPEQDGQQTAEGQTGTGTTGESELSTDVLPQDEPFV